MIYDVVTYPLAPNHQRPRYHRRWWYDPVLAAQSLNRNQ
jgi:hypothetical protein